MKIIDLSSLQESTLSGGRAQIKRLGQYVVRPSNEFSQQIYQFLTLLRKQGFTKAPIFYGLDGQGNEVLEFLRGDVHNYPLPKKIQSDSILISVANLLNEFHKASAKCLESMPKFSAMLQNRQPAQVICHGDVAPYNMVINDNQVTGLIDFDTAFIGPKLWDIAYAAYRFCPLNHQGHDDNFNNKEEQIRRLYLFLETYGLDKSDVVELLSVLIIRLCVLVDFMQQQAKLGEQCFIDNLNDGHHLQYLQDIEYIKNIIKHLEV
jgi:aminoglycoside phosphotransferase (APT) family kinase protein